MNFFLIANNDNISDKTISELPITDNDVIILYNRQMPLKWDKIKSHNNKLLFLRRKEGGFHGEDKLFDNKNLYNKIYLSASHIIDNDTLLKYEEKYKIKLYKFIEKDDDIRKHIEFKDNKVPQTGLISYLFVKDNFNYDKIFLVGFTNTYKNGIWHGHSKEIEQEFYEVETSKSENIIKIDA